MTTCGSKVRPTMIGLTLSCTRPPHADPWHRCRNPEIVLVIIDRRVCWRCEFCWDDVSRVWLEAVGS